MNRLLALCLLMCGSVWAQGGSTREIDVVGGQAEPATYAPPSAEQRRAYWLRSAFGPTAIGAAGISALIDQGYDEVPEWGGGLEGFGKRLGWRAVSFATQNTVSYAVSTVLREDTNYYRCACTGLFPRTAHAIVSGFTARRPSGRRTFSVARVVGAYSGGAVLIAFTPDRYNLRGDGVRYGTWQYVSIFPQDLLREFWPDIRRRIFRK